jgi:hypothetical protein
LIDAADEPKKHGPYRARQPAPPSGVIALQLR